MASPRTDYRLTARQRSDAREALQILSDSGLSLADAARRAVAQTRRIDPVTVAVAAERFFLSRARKANRRGELLRPATLEWYHQFLAPVIRDWGDEPLHRLEPARFTAWLHSLKTGNTFRVSVARASRSLWRWAIEQTPPLAENDATAGLSTVNRQRSDAERAVLTVAQAEAILAAVGNARSAVALMLFAGLRPEELTADRPGKPRLTWQNVDPVEKYVRVPAEVSKTGKTRVLEHLPDTLWAWVTPGHPGDPVAPVNGQTIRDRARAAAGLRKWPHDCFRRTAASYLMTFTRDAGRVSEWLGHEGRPTLLHQVYRGVVALDGSRLTKERAEAYFALRPASTPTDGAAG